MKKCMFLISVLIVLFSLKINAAEIESFIIVYGNKHVYAIVLPKEWKLDKKIALQNKFGTFMYPKNYTGRQQIPTYIHSTGYDKRNYKNQSLASFIEDDKNIISKTGNVKVNKIGEVDTYNSGKAMVYHYLYIIDKRKIKQIEYVAFIDTPTAFCNVTFSTDNVEDLVKYEGPFNLVVSSFNYLGDDVNKARKELPH
jgi:hypothetical protein